MVDDEFYFDLYGTSDPEELNEIFAAEKKAQDEGRWKDMATLIERGVNIKNSDVVFALRHFSGEVPQVVREYIAKRLMNEVGRQKRNSIFSNDGKTWDVKMPLDEFGRPVFRNVHWKVAYDFLMDKFSKNEVILDAKEESFACMAKAIHLKFKWSLENVEGDWNKILKEIQKVEESGTIIEGPDIERLIRKISHSIHPRKKVKDGVNII